MSDKQKFFFVAGNPVLHSLSPVLFNAFAMEKQLLHKYVKALCNSAADVQMLLQNGFAGGNITAPFKEDILLNGYQTSTTVEKIKAANTVFEKNDVFFLENTDVYGVSLALKQHIQDFKGKKAVVTGAGGAARAAAFALLKLGCNVTLINRTEHKARYWSQLLGCQFLPEKSAADCLEKAHILVNTLSHTDKLTSGIHSHLTVLDADYKNSPLKDICQIKGATYISGLNWLVWQAVSAYEHFTAKKVNPQVLFDALNNPVHQQTKNIVLVGMMKSGKSTVGDILAQKTGRVFTDTDELVEQFAGKKISQIFAEDGEDEFRKIESQVFARCMHEENQVIATGGGLVVDQNNRVLINKHGLCVWLFTSVTSLIARQDNTPRPLLKGEGIEEKLNAINHQRFSMYADCADLVLPVDRLSPDECGEILSAELNCYK